MKLTELKEKVTTLMEREVKLTGLNFFLLTAVLVLAGICIGLLNAPFTHGISIGSHNGCNNGNNSPCNNGLEQKEDKEEEA